MSDQPISFEFISRPPFAIGDRSKYFPRAPFSPHVFHTKPFFQYLLVPDRKLGSVCCSPVKYVPLTPLCPADPIRGTSSWECPRDSIPADNVLDFGSVVLRFPRGFSAVHLTRKAKGSPPNPLRSPFCNTHTYPPPPSLF